MTGLPVEGVLPMPTKAVVSQEKQMETDHHILQLQIQGKFISNDSCTEGGPGPEGEQRGGRDGEGLPRDPTAQEGASQTARG